MRCPVPRFHLYTDSNTNYPTVPHRKRGGAPGEVTARGVAASGGEGQFLRRGSAGGTAACLVGGGQAERRPGKEYPEQGRRRRPSRLRRIGRAGVPMLAVEEEREVRPPLLT